MCCPVRTCTACSEPQPLQCYLGGERGVLNVIVRNHRGCSCCLSGKMALCFS